MIKFRHILVCLAAALTTFGLSHVAPAYDSDENEASEHHDSHAEGSEREDSEHNGSHNEGTEHSGSGSSGSASSNSDSVNDNSRGTESSREDSRRRASSRSTSTGNRSTRSASTARVTGSRTSAASRTTRSRDGGTERKATLRTIVGGRGSAEYKVSGTNRTFEVELENTTLSPGQSLSVCVNDVTVGAMTVGLSGRRTKAKLKLETRLGQAVPTISAGSVVTIKLSTATVASGTF